MLCCTGYIRVIIKARTIWAAILIMIIIEIILMYSGLIKLYIYLIEATAALYD